MRAIVIPEPGGPDVLTLADRPDPHPGFGQVRVRVHFAGLNRADLLQRAGFYPAPPGAPPDIPGLEYAGIVDAVATGCARLKPGDRVFGLAAGGAHAELIVLHEREVVPLPEGVELRDAAAFPEAFVTAYDALLSQARLEPGERVLIHAAGSGVGTAGIQIARALGCFVIGTSRTQDKLDRCAELGTDVGIVPDGASFAAKILAATGGRGVDVVLDLVGGRYTGESLGACGQRARIVVVGLTGGASAEVSLAALLHKRVTIIGTVLRSRPLEEKIAAARVLERNLTPWLLQRRVRSVVDRVFPLDEAGRAHAYLAGNESFGKVVLAIP